MLSLITKLIDGKFPEFKGVLETKMSANITVNRSEFIETLTRAAVLTTDRFKGVKIQLSDGTLSVTANNPEQEEALEEMAIDYAGTICSTVSSADFPYRARNQLESGSLCLPVRTTPAVSND